ncbi:MAG: HAD family phosphatase [Patescibacteria group bacterium]|jgi:putative hydrolase of the HAD superfamily
MDSKVTTFIFDCFDVLLAPVVTRWYRENSAKLGFVDENLQDILRQFDLALLSEADLMEYLLKYPGVNSTVAKLQSEIDAHLEIDEALVVVIKKLKNKSFKTALLSNANHSFFERKVYSTYPEFKGLFDEIVISSAVKMVKPDKNIYLYTLAKINSKAEECLFIDDNKTNVAAAVALGMNGYVYTDYKSFADFITESGIELEAGV